jgi:hypothetical protein
MLCGFGKNAMFCRCMHVDSLPFCPLYPSDKYRIQRDSEKLVKVHSTLIE